MNNQEKCYSCGGKGTYSQMHGIYGAEDFHKREGFTEKPSIHTYPCTACNGTGFKPSSVHVEKCKRIGGCIGERCLHTNEYDVIHGISSPPEVSWESSLKELLDEYAGCYRAVDNCSDSIGGVEDCHICKEDKERMHEIIKELEASIRKEVVEEIAKLQEEVYEDLVGEYQAIPIGSLRSYALSKGITLK